MVEYSSPNTNKPLHLGHIRNNLLGFSISEILKSVGHKVIKANLINDRGIHICKSMLAWQKWGNGETPASSGLKGDHLVGKYYVLFDKEYKKEIEELKSKGIAEDEARKQAPLILEVQQMLRQWEAGDKATIDLWKMMNIWVYEGFDKTYKELGVDFDRFYYESETYLLGKKIVEKGLQKGVFFKKDDGSVWIDLTSDGLDQKLLLRKDGTSVYITQDLGTALQRFEEYSLDKSIYVIGNEQNYHIKVLALILKKLGYQWADAIYHFAYGMVDLPSGKMKSREGTVVDADDLIKEMTDTAAQISKELGKADELSYHEAEKLFKVLAMGALKYFILKVDPQKRMVFNPAESIDFNGNTGPFIQYTYARICSLLKKAAINNLSPAFSKGEGNKFCLKNISNKEKELIRLLYLYPETLKEAADSLSPALIANYIYELTREYNQYYQETPILKAETENLISFRLALSKKIGETLKSAFKLLGIEMPERM
jgi:arginyl-tRNA synthetase